MGKMWEFFENLDEMVYVSDIETNELVYMNRHLRESLGYATHEKYKGMMCYEVLQGSDKPCSFCTNDRLCLGDFVTWTHENPILNQRVLLKDTLIQEDGKNYRLEMAIDADSRESCNTPYYYARSETILNECIQQIFSTANAEESIERMLAYIGHAFSTDRSYIFEIHEDGLTSNTYEWCAEKVDPQKEILQKLPVAAIDWWVDLFADGQVTVIPDLEMIRSDHPEAYAILKPQNIHSLAVGPIKVEDEVIGFIGVDNPDIRMLPMLESFLRVIGYFTSTLLRRRDLLRSLNNLSYHDQLTGAMNRHALSTWYSNPVSNPAGVIYCDISGLKQVNDTLGHKAGDSLIRRSYELIHKQVGTDLVYRAGGDEFIVLCLNCTQQEFLKKVHDLRKAIREKEYHIATGFSWSDELPVNLEKLVIQADQAMYEDKRQYYQISGAGNSGEAEEKLGVAPKAEPISRFQKFLAISNYDNEVILQSMAQDNDSSYFYFGDMLGDLFYISDNMRDDFGFQSNLAPHLLDQWADRISTPEFRELYWQDIQGMLKEQRTVHDMRYQVRDVRGENQWIRCYGILKWDSNHRRPLFFSGRITHQDVNFVVDPVTGLPRDQVSYRQLEEIKRSGKKTIVLGFGLNGITEINSTKGREYGDRLLKKVGDALSEQLSARMYFYRLEGARCMAVVTPEMAQQHTAGELVDQIRQVVQACYQSMDISVRNVCSFGMIEFPNGEMTVKDVIGTLLSLVRVARQDPKQEYVDYSEKSIQQIRSMSNMILALADDVANGMRNFRIVIQPVVSAATGSPIAGEVLLRWKFEGRDVSPGIFIPILEKQGLIQAAGRWVFEQAVAACVRIHSYDLAFCLTFNVSMHQLSDPLLIPFMRETLQKYRLEGSSLVMELTESSLDNQPEELTHFVNQCEKMGIYTALDDFGSGYSSLRMLLQYPCSIIKLDRSLVGEAIETEAKLNFIRSIVFACHQFGKTVCVEGVETHEQNETIVDTGCDMIQGYYYYRPMELSDIYRLLSNLAQEGKAGE